MKKEQMEIIIKRNPVVKEVYRYYKKTGYMVGRTVTGDLFLGTEGNLQFFKYSEEMKKRVLEDYEFNKKY